MMAAATVRLYKLNPATNGYEAHAGGQPMGCVVLGKYTIRLYTLRIIYAIIIPKNIVKYI